MSAILLKKNGQGKLKTFMAEYFKEKCLAKASGPTKQPLCSPRTVGKVERYFLFLQLEWVRGRDKARCVLLASSG